MKKYRIVDRVNNHDTVPPIEAANGKSALNKYQMGLMSSGIYTKIKDGANWHLVTSYGADFEAVPIEEDDPVE